MPTLEERYAKEKIRAEMDALVWGIIFFLLFALTFCCWGAFWLLLL